MQKLKAVKGRLEVIITPELGSSELKQNVEVPRLSSVAFRTNTATDYDLKYSHTKQTLHLPNFCLKRKV